MFLTQLSKTIITRSVCGISLIVFTDKYQGHVQTLYTKWLFITFKLYPNTFEFNNSTLFFPSMPQPLNITPNTHQPWWPAALNRATSLPLVDSLTTCPGPIIMINFNFAAIYYLSILKSSIKIDLINLKHVKVVWQKCIRIQWHFIFSFWEAAETRWPKNKNQWTKKITIWPKIEKNRWPNNYLPNISLINELLVTLGHIET